MVDIDELLRRVDQFRADLAKAACGEHAYSRMGPIRREFREWFEERRLGVVFPDETGRVT